ncbi:MAG: hypothetical protein DWQ34_06335 [Planctomycetota bacterium]|nr:MAG: hypothetical protein DWQ34_06335 [Planctomycetota bacterium]REK24239.1 MAG: hypothetical protein DWQ41_14490 [Planctomycetota bacterium]REK28776.1 MAG: hypothetical protein DWQ45_24030 [Planctomycetota bacterium]
MSRLPEFVLPRPSVTRLAPERRTVPTIRAREGQFGSGRSKNAWNCCGIGEIVSFPDLSRLDERQGRSDSSK